MSGFLGREESGAALISFDTDLGEHETGRLEPGVPMPLVLVVAVRQDAFLAVYDRWKGDWELPGGMIEPDETPRQAAYREFREETSLVARSLNWVGVARFEVVSDKHPEYAAVYLTDDFDDVDIESFTENDEIAALRWIAGVSELPEAGLDGVIAAQALGW